MTTHLRARFGRASAFEFRWRFLVIAGIFSFGFFLYAIDHRNLATALAALFTGAPASDGAVRAVLGAGAALAIAGAALRTWATAYLSSDVVHDLELHREHLVAAGPYRHVRNPLYLGLVLLSLGMALAASRLGGAWIVLAILVFQARLVAREEAELLGRHGESYAAYLARVPGLLPAAAPRLPDAGSRPRWGQALFGEAFVWIFALALAVFAVTLDVALLGKASGIGVALYLVLVPLWRRRARAARV